MADNNWKETSEELPENGVVVETKIDDENGLRNHSRLFRDNRLWYVADGSMYVYYTPTHWRGIEADA